MTLPRLDILIYAHDGRGLGHASRSTGIGMALRRLFPQKKVLFVSGCKQTASLIGAAPLDWVKLLSYETEVIAGASKGTQGNSNFRLKELGRYRADTLRHLVAAYRPRVVLVDHQPQGKQKEMLPAIEETRNTDTRWVLGVRGIVGGVPQVHSELSQKVFAEHFANLFWYGDARILGKDPINALAAHFNTRPLEMGYVSRMAEFLQWHPPSPETQKPLAGTVSIPWIGEHTLAAISKIAEALRRIGDSHGPWRLFIGSKSQSEKTYVADQFKDLSFCQVEAPSDLYPEALTGSRFSLIYGGYNSIIDILQIGTPAVVLMRDMRDGEQKQHLKKLNESAHADLDVFPEAELTAEDFAKAFSRRSNPSRQQKKEINLSGADNTARRLVELLGQ